MLWELTPDQEFFRQTTAKFLADQVPVDVLRRLRDDPGGQPASYWQRGAELGWTSLLLSEDHGGGTISGDALVDLALIAHEFGSHAAPGPLVPANVVAGALSDAGSHPAALEEIASGAAVGTWCSSGPGVQIRSDGETLVLTGATTPVESADRAAYLLVTGSDTQVLVPAETPGVSTVPLKTVDLTRRFCAVHFDEVRVPREAVVGEIGGAAETLAQQLRVAVVLSNAESIGAMQTTFDMTVQWAFDRYSFGRPLASYQALKHRFADMLMWLQVSHALNDAAIAAVSAAAPDADELVSAAKAYIGQYGAELVQDCVQMHGGIGVTFEHDIHLYLRRVTVNRALFGTPADHRQQLAVALAEMRTA